MSRIFLGIVSALALFGLSTVEASAACGGTTAQLTDAAAATRQMALVNDPTGTNCAGVSQTFMGVGAGVDGWDATQGLTTDAAITAGAPGTMGAKLRAISRDIGTLTTLFNANGRATSANSSPTVQAPAPSNFHLVAAATNNATSVKASAATVFSCQLGGVGSAPAYLKIYNKASAPTPASDTVVKTLIIPAASTAALGGGSNVNFGPGGLTLGTGFAVAIVAGIGDTDNTSVAASTFVVNCDYE